MVFLNQILILIFDLKITEHLKTHKLVQTSLFRFLLQCETNQVSKFIKISLLQKCHVLKLWLHTVIYLISFHHAIQYPFICLFVQSIIKTT
jgi:hypothetical protein